MSKPTRDDLLNDPLVRQVVEKYKAENLTALAAMADPLPGPLKEAFAPDLTVAVGEHRLRPFYDADFEMLAMLNHPLQKMMESAMEDGKEPDLPLPRGPQAWQAIWLLTTDIDAAEDMFRQGVDKVKEAARLKFSRKGIHELAQLYTGVVKQMSRYWNPVLAYGPAEAEAAPGEEKPAANPSTAPLSTASGG